MSSLEALFAVFSPSAKATVLSGLSNLKRFSLKVLAIKHRGGPSGLPLGGHLHKGDPTWGSSLPVSKDLDGHDASCLGEESPEFGLARLRRKVRHIEFSVHRCSFRSTLYNLSQVRMRALSLPVLFGFSRPLPVENLFLSAILTRGKTPPLHWEALERMPWRP